MAAATWSGYSRRRARTNGVFLSVPTGYVSGTALSDSAIYSGTTLADLGVTPGTYVWTWGTTANQNFTLEILPAPPPATNMTNISTRALVSADQYQAIAGFTITGTEPKQVVIRGLGPTLTGLIAHTVLADPMLGLYDDSGTLRSSLTTIRKKTPGHIGVNIEQKDAIEATGFAPSFDVESAILITLQPGKYTAILGGYRGGVPPSQSAWWRSTI